MQFPKGFDFTQSNWDFLSYLINCATMANIIQKLRISQNLCFLYLKSLSWWEVKRWTLHTWSTKVEQIRPHVLCTIVYRGQNTQPNRLKRPAKVGTLKKYEQIEMTTLENLNFFDNLTLDIWIPVSCLKGQLVGYKLQKSIVVKGHTVPNFHFLGKMWPKINTYVHDDDAH